MKGIGAWRIYLKEGVVEVEHLSAHEVLGANSAEDHNVTPDACITKDTNTPVGIEASEGLGNLGRGLACTSLGLCGATHLVVKTGLLDHVDEDVVSLTGDLNSLLGNIAKNSDSDSWSAFELVSRRFNVEGKGGNENREGDQHTRGMGACLRATRGCRVADQLPGKLSKMKARFVTMRFSLPSLHLSVQ